MTLTGDSWLPLVAGAGTAMFFLMLTAKMYFTAGFGAVVALIAVLWWLWETDRGSLGRSVDIGDGVHLPLYVSGARSHSWWAMVVLLFVDGSIFASLMFAYLYLWTSAPGSWPPVSFVLPEFGWTAAAALLWLAAASAMGWARALLETELARRRFERVLGAAVAIAVCAIAVQAYGQWRTGLNPAAHAYGAAVYATLAWQAVHGVVLVFMGAYTFARSRYELLGPTRRVTFDNMRLFFHYTAGQGVVAIVMLELLPRALGGR
jgi:cytochrome c oxidase subunit I+III